MVYRFVATDNGDGTGTLQRGAVPRGASGVLLFVESHDLAIIGRALGWFIGTVSDGGVANALPEPVTIPFAPVSPEDGRRDGAVELTRLFGADSAVAFFRAAGEEPPAEMLSIVEGRK